MGNTHAKRQTKEERDNVKQNRAKAIDSTKQQIDNIRDEMMQRTIDDIKGSSNTEATVALQNMSKMNTLIDTAKVQIQRDGLPLTKADLIAIIIALNPQYANKIDEISQNTIQDLNAIIRIIIYNPNQYLAPNNVPEVGTRIENKPKSFTQYLTSKTPRVLLVGHRGF